MSMPLTTRSAPMRTIWVVVPCLARSLLTLHCLNRDLAYRERAAGRSRDEEEGVGGRVPSTTRPLSGERNKPGASSKETVQTWVRNERRTTQAWLCVWPCASVRVWTTLPLRSPDEITCECACVRIAATPPVPPEAAYCYFQEDPIITATGYTHPKIFAQ